MIKVAIAPVLENMEWANSGDYFFILANYYQKYEEYRNYFLKHKGKKWTIVDNGAYEFGQPLPLKELLEIYNEAGCNELILPDVEYDWEKTKELSRAALDELEEIYDYDTDVGRRAAPGLQYVLQGKSYKELVENCYEFVHERQLTPFNRWKINTLGIPLYKKNWRGRIDTVRALASGTTKKFHLLGMHDPIELAFYQEKDMVERCDGGFAVKFGCYDMMWSKSAEWPNDRKRFPNDITKLDSSEHGDAIAYNIATALAFAQRGDRLMNPGNEEFVDPHRERSWMR